MNKHADQLLERIKSRKALIGVIGMGYVGLPLVIRFCEEGFPVLGFDIDSGKVNRLSRGESYIKHIRSEAIAAFRSRNAFEATASMDRLKEPDAI